MALLGIRIAGNPAMLSFGNLGNKLVGAGLMEGMVGLIKQKLKITYHMRNPLYV